MAGLENMPSQEILCIHQQRIANFTQNFNEIEVQFITQEALQVKLISFFEKYILYLLLHWSLDSTCNSK